LGRPVDPDVVIIRHSACGSVAAAGGWSARSNSQSRSITIDAASMAVASSVMIAMSARAPCLADKEVVAIPNRAQAITVIAARNLSWI
jgi:hypothetical protein